MTSKLTITDERLAELVAFKPLPGTDINSAARDEWMVMAAELQERRRADSEPVVEVLSSRPGNDTSTIDRALPVGTQLYRHAQPAREAWSSAAIEVLQAARSYVKDAAASNGHAFGVLQAIDRAIRCADEPKEQPAPATRTPVAWTSLRALETKNQIVAFTDDMSALDYGVANGWADIVELYLHALPETVASEEIISELEQVRDWILNTLPVPTPLTIPNARRLTNVINACRAAMLQAGNSPVIGIDLASGPDYSVEVRYVAPPGYVMVPKEPTPEILAVISEAIRAMRGSAATYARVLAAAPQEVPDGQR